MSDPLAVAALVVALTGTPSWEGWEPKRTLPTQAVETLEAQATVLIPPLVIEHPVERWRGHVAAYAGWDVDRMMKIMACESEGNPNAVSRTDDWGLLQIHAPIWAGAFGVTRQQLLDPTVNVDIAWRVWSQQSYGAWVCDR